MSIRLLPFSVKRWVLALVLTVPAWAGAAATAPDAPPASLGPPPASIRGDAAGEASRMVQLGAGDSVTLSVFGQPDMATTAFVADDGTLTVPLAGPVKVDGLSPAEAARRVEKALRDGRYLVDPHVTISAIVSRSQRVSVIGEVKTPGRYVVESNIPIVDLLAEAGGATENASDTIYILRKDKDGKESRFPIDLKGLSKGNMPVLAQSLHAGDSVFVPRAEQFYIYGEVMTPGKFRVEPGMTVIQAIARAGGLTVRGTQRRVEVKRLLPNGSYETSKAKLEQPVHPDDVIRVKESIF